MPVLTKALLAAALAIPCVSAAPVPKTEMYDGMPPARLQTMDGKPRRVVFGELQGCGKPDVPGYPNAYFAACIRGGTVYLPNPCSVGDREEFARLTCHELAHFRHWPKDHGQ